jgi:hypothetical protein
MRAVRVADFTFVDAEDAPKTGSAQARMAIAAKECREADTGTPSCLDNRGSLPLQRRQVLWAAAHEAFCHAPCRGDMQVDIFA